MKEKNTTKYNQCLKDKGYEYDDKIVIFLRRIDKKQWKIANIGYMY